MMNPNLFIFIIISIHNATLEFNKSSNILLLNNTLNNINKNINKYINYIDLIFIINKIIKKYNIKNVYIDYLYNPITNILEIIRSTVLLVDNNFIELKNYVHDIIIHNQNTSFFTPLHI